MRRYHIYFEPFVDKIRVNQYIGLDMSFYSELLPVESLIYILDTVIIDELTFKNNKRWKEDLQKDLGIENIQLNFFDAPNGWMKDGSYEDCKHVRTVKQQEICPADEVRLCVFTQSAKPCKAPGPTISDFLVVDYKSAEFNWNYEISAYFNPRQKEEFQYHGEIVAIDSRKSNPICSKYHGNLHGDHPSTESSVAWTGPLLTEVTFYDCDSILKNIGKIETIDDLFRIAPHLSDF